MTSSKKKSNFVAVYSVLSGNLMYSNRAQCMPMFQYFLCKMSFKKEILHCRNMLCYDVVQCVPTFTDIFQCTPTYSNVLIYFMNDVLKIKGDFTLYQYYTIFQHIPVYPWYKCILVYTMYQHIPV